MLPFWVFQPYRKLGTIILSNIEHCATRRTLWWTEDMIYMVDQSKDRMETFSRNFHRCRYTDLIVNSAFWSANKYLFCLNFWPLLLGCTDCDAVHSDAVHSVYQNSGYDSFSKIVLNSCISLDSCLITKDSYYVKNLSLSRMKRPRYTRTNRRYSSKLYWFTWLMSSFITS